MKVNPGVDYQWKGRGGVRGTSFKGSPLPVKVKVLHDSRGDIYALNISILYNIVLKTNWPSVLEKWANM